MPVATLVAAPPSRAATWSRMFMARFDVPAYSGDDSGTRRGKPKALSLRAPEPTARTGVVS